MTFPFTFQNLVILYEEQAMKFCNKMEDSLSYDNSYIPICLEKKILIQT